MSRVTTPTPLDIFVGGTQSHYDWPTTTELGSEAFQEHVRTVAPFLPAILLHGSWIDWTIAPVADAIDAVKAAERQRALDDDPDTLEAEDLEAYYVTGVIIGLALASALASLPREVLPTTPASMQ
jgi:hypothetical protein